MANSLDLKDFHEVHVIVEWDKTIEDVTHPTPKYLFKGWDINFLYSRSSRILFPTSLSSFSRRDISNDCYHAQIQALDWDLFPSEAIHG
jgi:hypothetical protein